MVCKEITERKQLSFKKCMNQLSKKIKKQYYQLKYVWDERNEISERKHRKFEKVQECKSNKGNKKFSKF